MGQATSLGMMQSRLAPKANSGVRLSESLIWVVYPILSSIYHSSGVKSSGSDRSRLTQEWMPNHSASPQWAPAPFISTREETQNVRI